MRYLIYIILITFSLSSCTKTTKDLFDKPADERISEVLDNYRAALMQDPGWKLYVYPKGLENQDIKVGGLTYYMKFIDSNRVSMLSDFRIDMASVPKESGYRVRAIQFPSLVFDTYSYIHVAADPDPNVSSSPAPDAGFGWGTDFDFAFLETTPKDSIKLRGNFNNSEAVLLKASQEEIDAAYNGRLAEIMQATSDYNDANPLLYFPGSDNAKISVSFNLYLYIINFTYLASGDQLVALPSPFSHTTDGIHLKDPVSVGGYTFQDLFWDDALQIYYIKNGSQRIDLTNSDVPIFPFVKVLGKSITTIVVPTSALPGQSALFTTNYNTVKANLLNGPYGLELDIMRFIFDDASKTMALNVDVLQNGNTFLAQFQYSYTLTDAGIATFTYVGSNGNGSLVKDDFAPLLDYLEGDHFLMDYFTGTAPVLGQFTSQENPTFYFTGDLQ